MSSNVYNRKHRALEVVVNIPYFLENMPQLLFISSLLQCDIYSRVVLIRGRHLISLGVLTCNLVTSTFTRQFPADAVTDHEEFVFVCSFMCTGRSTW